MQHTFLTSFQEPHQRIIVALDGDLDQEEVCRLVRLLKPHVGLFKIGLRLFTRHGPSVIHAVRAEGGLVMLDLKYHDIPKTVEEATREASKHGVSLLTIHASSTRDGIKAAVTGAEGRVGILGVTVLTSIKPRTCHTTYGALPSRKVVQFAKWCVLEGALGIVCSPHELRAVPKSLIRVTPGVRPTGAAMDDQARIDTPANAIANGADFLVIGRPILDTVNPAKAAEHIGMEIADRRAHMPVKHLR